MVKICNDAIKKPLSIVCRNCIKTGIYPNAWKKSNIFPVHKIEDKKIVNNYKPVSLLPIFGKVFENSLCNNQSGFRPSDSGEYQLNSIDYDCNPQRFQRDTS